MKTPKTTQTNLAALFALVLSLSGCMTADSGVFQSNGATSEATSGGSGSGSGSSSNSGSGSGAGAAGSASVQISWTAAAGAPAGYSIEQSTDGIIYAAATTSPLTSTSAKVTGLAAGTTYYFRVQAYNAGGSSGYSPVITAAIP